MDRFFGFDLGDAESAIARLYKEDQVVPEMIPVAGEKSFITAYAQLTSGELLIGEKACYADNVTKRRLRFKSRFLTDTTGTATDVRSFAAGVLGELYGNGDLIQNEETSVYVGCPAGWDRNAREHYREIFESAGYPPVKIISDLIGSFKHRSLFRFDDESVDSIFIQYSVVILRCTHCYECKQ